MRANEFGSRLKAFVVSQGECDPIAEGVQKIVLSLLRLLAEELGLDAGDVPPLDELVARLRDLRPAWQWKEALVPALLRLVGGLRKLAEPGIYNAAIAVLADRSPFTVGLERDLSDLQSVPDSDIAKSSLGVLLGKTLPRVADDDLLLEPAPLNAEQRNAVRDALTEPLTVITGPRSRRGGGRARKRVGRGRL